MHCPKCGNDELGKIVVAVQPATVYLAIQRITDEAVIADGDPGSWGGDEMTLFCLDCGERWSDLPIRVDFKIPGAGGKPKS